ncbi:hypothetical protein OAG96_02265 [Akkermansiaceae bacterium]|nr:hypothetical protein [Akkermansiaceae bacterium]
MIDDLKIAFFLEGLGDLIQALHVSAIHHRDLSHTFINKPKAAGLIGCFKFGQGEPGGTSGKEKQKKSDLGEITRVHSYLPRRKGVTETF